MCGGEVPVTTIRGKEAKRGHCGSYKSETWFAWKPQDAGLGRVVDYFPRRTAVGWWNNP